MNEYSQYAQALAQAQQYNGPWQQQSSKALGSDALCQMYWDAVAAEKATRDDQPDKRLLLLED